MKTIVAAGFNPAWQKVITFEKIICGKVNRASGIEEFASGKGINFCRAAKCYGMARTSLLQFCGGSNGDRVDSCLTDEGMNFFSIRTEAATRCCDTCIDLSSGSVTELIEPSFPATAGEVSLYIEHFAEALKNASAAAFCGTLPTGTDGSLYEKLAKISASSGVPLLVDAWRDVDAIFSSGAEIWLKINREELAALTGKAEISEAFAYLKNRWGISTAAVTDGAGQAFAFDGKHIACYTLPELEKVVNPIGCGDTASSVLCSELVNGRDLFTSFRNALGAASANCLSSFCGSFAQSEARELAEKTEYIVSDLD